MISIGGGGSWGVRERFAHLPPQIPTDIVSAIDPDEEQTAEGAGGGIQIIMEAPRTRERKINDVRANRLDASDAAHQLRRAFSGASSDSRRSFLGDRWYAALEITEVSSGWLTLTRFYLRGMAPRFALRSLISHKSPLSAVLAAFIHQNALIYKKNNAERSFTDRTQGTLPRKTCEHQSDSWKGLNVSEDLRQGWAAWIKSDALFTIRRRSGRFSLVIFNCSRDKQVRAPGSEKSMSALVVPSFLYQSFLIWCWQFLK